MSVSEKEKVTNNINEMNKRRFFLTVENPFMAWPLCGKMAERAARICGVADSLGVGTPCYEELLFYSTYNFHPNSEDFFRLCNALDEQWRTQCLARGER